MKKASSNAVSFKQTDETAEIEVEETASVVASQPLSTISPAGDIVGEPDAEDLSGYCRVKLIQATSAESGTIPPGNFALVDPSGRHP